MRMKPIRRVVLLLAVLSLACGVGCCSLLRVPFQRRAIRKGLLETRSHGQGRLAPRGNIPVLHLYGTPEQMGEQYGTILRGPLRALDGMLSGVLPKGYRERYVAFAIAHEQTLPDQLRREVRAISQAAGIPYEHLLALNTVPRMRCSALAVWGQGRGDQGLIMGRNAEYFDLGLGDRASILIVRHPAGGMAHADVNMLGMVGAFTGINEEGVAFGNMLVFNARDDRVQADGMPIQAALRLAAERSGTAEEMCELLRSQTHMIPMNVMVSDDKEALVVELAPGDSTMRRGRGGVLAASNYFLSPETRAHQVECERYAALVASAEARDGGFGVEDMKEALHSARLERLNLHAVIFEPVAMRMHLSINRVPATGGPYTVIDVRELLAVPPEQ